MAFKQDFNFGITTNFCYTVTRLKFFFFWIPHMQGCDPPNVDVNNKEQYFLNSSRRNKWRKRIKKIRRRRTPFISISLIAID